MKSFVYFQTTNKNETGSFAYFGLEEWAKESAQNLEHFYEMLPLLGKKRCLNNLLIYSSEQPLDILNSYTLSNISMLLHAFMSIPYYEICHTLDTQYCKTIKSWFQF